ncbi:integrase [Nitrosomonas sp.]|uniref:GumC family protein n=2 Tax=Nitrosomonas sp. TaxID=42353 RepID=UPI00285050A0|nr:integrase [Nitrosomonas sp.]MDR4513134.1 integrase [Nitrosomonas sp.]
MSSRLPSETVVSLNDASNDWYPPQHEPKPWFRSRRLIIFTIAFLTSAALTLGYVYSRPAIYLSYATLLTVAKTAIDLPSGDADIQHVAIQKQILLGSELLTETSRRLKTVNDTGVQINLSSGEIRQMLDVRPVPETNLIEMVAEGPEPEILPLLINTWIDVYLDARAAEVSRLLGDTTQIIQDELDGLAKKIQLKRVELDQFRQEHDIASIEREENEALARLKGLNESLNDASEDEVKAKAKLDAINKAIERGQAVVPQEDTRTLSLLEDRAQELRQQLAELNLRYTQEYLNLSPSLKVIPEQLSALEAEIKRMRQHGQTVVQSDAQQEYAAAKQTADEIRQQLNAHKKKATAFSARFTEHEALKGDLEALESLYRESQERLVQIETRYAGKYPQVDVIERAFLPGAPVYPDYLRDTGIATAVSIIFSLFCVWIAEFLTRKTEPRPVVNLSGIHLYDRQIKQDSFELPRQSVDQLPVQNPVLSSPPPMEIPAQQISVLLLSAGDKEKLLIALLLSGVTLEEITMIKQEDIDADNGKLMIHGKSPRVLPLSQVLKSFFASDTCRLTDSSGDLLSEEDLAALLTCAIADANLSESGEINADSLRQTYLIYLVKQGIRLAELEKIAGYIPPKILSSYSLYQPAGPKRSYDEIDLVYPELHNVQFTS